MNNAGLLMTLNTKQALINKRLFYIAKFY